MHECMPSRFSPVQLCNPMNCSSQGPLSRKEKEKKTRQNSPLQTPNI